MTSRYTLRRSQALMGVVALSMFEQPRDLSSLVGAPLRGCKPRITAEQPQGPTTKRAKVKAARKAARKKK